MHRSLTLRDIKFSKEKQQKDSAFYLAGIGCQGF